ncbi:hypothetical protein LB505_001280 [Fusarium chuoi]|nr:hypothetical protein LB505_001280 [Fusarium chuoi]
MLSFLNSLLSSEGILGEVIEFWQTVQGFINGSAQAALPVGYRGESRHHHELSPQSVDESCGTSGLAPRTRLFILRGHASRRCITAILTNPQYASPDDARIRRIVVSQRSSLQFRSKQHASSVAQEG